MKKVNEQMMSFENSIKVLEKKIQEIDVPNELKRIEKKIAINHKQTLVLGFLIILGLIAISIFK